MANSAQAIKRARQAVKRRAQNNSLRSALRTSMKNVVKAAMAGDKDAAVAAYQIAVPRIDKSVSKGIIHCNNAARYKSRLNARVKALAG
ncbi:MAG: 30S ribosomal protein S20 [Gammaproteobacteria bacterium]|nr:30S ribosomal protein S20 [Gammaproteobacteria bacterium]